ncbi:MAG TPA: hypothetical protein DCX03_06405 [Bacteroidales bacterium]|nr:hypothetical protein [Bacteroidales bacterium]
MVVKVNVSVSQEILDKLDRAARESHTSRSAFLAQAVEHYLKEKERENTEKLQREAARRIDRLREEFGVWDGTAEVLKWRRQH